MRIRSSKKFANPAVWLVLGACVAAESTSVSASASIASPKNAGPTLPYVGPTFRSGALQTPPPVKPAEVAKATEDPSYKPFLDRVKAYIDLRKKLDDGLPRLKPTDEPQRVETYEQLLAARIKAARSTAKPGDVFGSAGVAIKHAIGEDAKSRTVQDVYAAMQEVPPRDPPAVNATYPAKAALATVPPLLLLRLPKLPDTIEYRFMGRDLILHDTTTNIVVDFLRDAAPIIQKRKAEEKK